ncbi:hypothetical protein ACLOJK_014131 [Asimina triloba]
MVVGLAVFADVSHARGLSSSNEKQGENWKKETKDRYIKYPPINRGDGIPCNGENRDNCHKDDPANPPVRGCSPINQCRGDPPPLARDAQLPP